MHYADLEIRIQKRDAGGYPVELTLDGEQTLGRGTLSPSVFPGCPALTLLPTVRGFSHSSSPTTA